MIHPDVHFQLARDRHRERLASAAARRLVTPSPTAPPRARRSAKRAHLAVALVASTSVVACAGTAESTDPPAHPALDCAGRGSGTGNYDVAGHGFETAAAALEDRLGYYRDLYGGEIIVLSDDEAALRVDGSNVVVAAASAAASGGVFVHEDYFCNDHQPR